MSLNSQNLLESQETQPDIHAIMARIRERVKVQAERGQDEKKPFKPYVLDGTRAERKAGELLNSEELRYLNRNHAFALQQYSLNITSHRPFIGRLIVKIKRKFLSLLWDHLLKEYFHAEKEYNANLVRFLNDVSKYVDARDATNFWDLIRKIDYDVNKALERIERINDEQMASMRSSERRVYDTLNEALQELNRYITELVAAKAEHGSRIQTLESVTSGLERIISGVESRKNVSSSYMQAGVDTASRGTAVDHSYIMLENRYRGSEAEIKERLEIYPPIFKDATQLVLEIGSGRGELQELFKESRVPSYGIELDQAMVNRACEKSLDVRVGDALKHLGEISDRSLGGVVAVQVVEHLSRDALRGLLTLCKRKVAKGGKIVFETINSESMVALAQHYFRDPTHVWPLHPETMRFLMELAGLKVLEIRKLSPFGKENILAGIPVEDFMSPRWIELTKKLNRNFERLNALLYGHQDYCIIAEVD